MSLHFSNKEIILLLFGGVSSALCCLFFDNTGDTGSGSGSTLVSMAISAIFIAISTLLPLEQMLYMVAIGIPNTKALGFGGISCSIIVCAIAVIKYYIMRKEKPHLPMGIFIYLLFCIFSIFNYDNIISGIVMPLKQAINMIFFVLLISNSIVANNSFSIGLKASIALFLGIIFAFFSSIISSLDVGRLAVVGNDPNILAVEAAFVFVYICIAFVKSNFLSSLVFSIMAIVLCLICVLCGSRMGLLLFAIIILLTIALNANSSRKVFLMAIVIVIGAVLFLQSNLGQDLLNAFVMRMEMLESNDNVSNGRFELWNQYYKALNSSPTSWLFGLGDYTKYGIEDQAHNFLIEDLASYGIIGLLILYPTYIGIYKRQYKTSIKYCGSSRLNLYRLMPLMTPIIGGVTLHGLFSIMDTTMLYLGVLAMAKIPNSNKGKLIKHEGITN